MCTIVIADDHEFLLSGLQSMLENLGHEVVAAVGNGEEALAAIGPDAVREAVTKAMDAALESQGAST